MSKKLATLISTLLGAFGAAGIGIVTYAEPSNAALITSAISLGVSTAITIVESFAKPPLEKKEEKEEK